MRGRGGGRLDIPHPPQFFSPTSRPSFSRGRSGVWRRRLGVVAKRKAVKVVQKPNYTVVDYRNPPRKQILRYRTVKTKTGHLVRGAVLRRKGPRGGRTVATSVWHPKSERKSRRGR